LRGKPKIRVRVITPSPVREFIATSKDMDTKITENIIINKEQKETRQPQLNIPPKLGYIAIVWFMELVLHIRNIHHSLILFFFLHVEGLLEQWLLPVMVGLFVF